MMSAEPVRKRAYSVDLRWRIVYQRIGMDLPFSKIAKNLNVAIRYRIPSVSEIQIQWRCLPCH